MWVEEIRKLIPEYAKDISLNLDSAINRSSLDQSFASNIALAAAVATGNSGIVSIIKSSINDEVETNAVFAASSIMAQNNVWYPYIEMVSDKDLKGLPALLRMNVISNHGGSTKIKFESYSLAASIIGKCHFCVKAHYETLKNEGLTTEQLRDIGRISATINAISKIIVE